MPPGRKSKYNLDVQKRICDAIEGGQTQQVACRIANIDMSTFTRWTGKNAHFAKTVALARANFENKAVGVISKAAFEGFTIQGPKGAIETAPDWRAADRLLAVRNPEVYARRDRVDINGGSGLSIQINLGD